jgi:cell division protein FtsB
MKTVKKSLIIIIPLVLLFLLIYCYKLKTDNENIKTEVSALKSQKQEVAIQLAQANKDHDKLKDKNNELLTGLKIEKEKYDEIKVTQKNVPSDISFITSVDSWKEKEYRQDVSPEFRYRAIYHRPLDGEARSWLEVQKLTNHGGYETEILWSKKIDIMSNDVTLKAYNEICGGPMDCEARLGCCSMNDIRWDKLVLLYKIYTRNHGSKHIREFQCKADKLPFDDFTIECHENNSK